MLDWTAVHGERGMTRAGEYQPGLVTPNNGTRPKPTGRRKLSLVSATA